MKYYESTLRLRIPSSDVYGIHQHLDYFIQEQCKAKFPYSFSIQPGTGNDTHVLLRTVQAVGVPGEVQRNVYFSEGQEVTITGTIAAVRREVLNGRKREVCPPCGELPEFVKYRLGRAGLTPHHVGVNKMDSLIVKKADQPTQKGHRIHIPACTFHANGIVSSVADFEKAFVFGVGRKRIFGVGQITVTTK